MSRSRPIQLETSQDTFDKVQSPRRFVVTGEGRASPYVHLRQRKTLYLNPNLTLAQQSDPNTRPIP